MEGVAGLSQSNGGWNTEVMPGQESRRTERVQERSTGDED